mgnify:CR=1 FL=1
MARKLTEKVSWVGKIDWELKRFHGDEYSTHRGSSYNAYLIRDRKTVLIDTAWLPFDHEFVNNLKREIDLKDIDAIVMQHNEVDHSGALPALMREIPDTPIYCTANGVKILKGHYHQDWKYVPVKTGDTLDLGETMLTFIEAPMLHWPDTMFSYMSGENILFSNDGFGQHFASESLYNDMVDKGALYEEATKYYANILAPFSPMVRRKIDEVLGMNLPIDMICPSHGLIWRDHPEQIVEQYRKWADNYQENQVSIVYDTMWNSTNGGNYRRGAQGSRSGSDGEAFQRIEERQDRYRHRGIPLQGDRHGLADRQQRVPVRDSGYPGADQGRQV